MGIQINGQTDTITATDGSFTIQGASGNLTGDLVGNVTGNLTGNVNSTGVTTVSSLRIGTGASISSPATNVLTLGTNNSERVRIDSSGNIGIGTDTIQANTNYNTLEIVGDSGTTGGGIVRLKTGNLAAKTMLFCDTGGFEARVETNHPFVISTNDTERLRITSAGAVQIANGNLVFSTAGTGIDFSATANSSGTMTSELLSDYEEGSFTPTIYGWTGTYAIQYGHYTKIGRQVFIHCEVLTNASTGSFTEPYPGVGNLPFAISSNANRHLGNWGFLGNQTVPANSVGAGQWDQYNSTALFPNDFKTNAAIGNWNSQSNSVSLGYRSFISYFVA